MTRVKLGLCLLSAASALSLVMALPAAAAPHATASSAGGAATAGKIQTALVPASAPAPKVVKLSVAPGQAITAANQDGACNMVTNGDGDFCYWFSTNFVGSMSDFATSDTNLSDNTFLTPGLGLGQPVADNSESALNADSNSSVVVFTGAGFTGAAGLVTARAFGNFNATFVNNVASHRFQ